MSEVVEVTPEEKCDILSEVDLLLDAVSCSDGDELHYIHLPKAISKKLFQPKLKVKPDVEFLLKEVESLANLTFLNNAYDPYTSQYGERLLDVIDSSGEIHSSCSTVRKRLPISIISNDNAFDLQFLSDSYKDIPDVGNDYRLEEPLIEDCLASTLNVWSGPQLDYQPILDGQWESLAWDVKEEHLELNSYLKSFPDLDTVASTTCTPDAFFQLENIVATNINIHYEELENFDEMIGSSSSLSNMLELLNRDFLINQSGGNKSNETSLHATTSGSHFTETVASGNISSSANSTAESSRKLFDSTNSPVTSFNVTAKTEMNVNAVRDYCMSFDEEFVCHLNEKDALNCNNNEIAPDNNLPAIKSNGDMLIVSKNVKANDGNCHATSPTNGSQELHPTARMIKKRDQERSKDNDKPSIKLVDKTLTSDAGSEVKSINSDVWSIIKKYTEAAMEKPVVPFWNKIKDREVLPTIDELKLVHENVKTNIKQLMAEKQLIKHLITGGNEVNEKALQKPKQQIISLELEPSPAKKDTGVSLRDDANSPCVPRESAEFKIKATKLVPGSRYALGSLVDVRRDVLAKFNDWVIDGDWMWEREETSSSNELSMTPSQPSSVSEIIKTLNSPSPHEVEKVDGNPETLSTQVEPVECRTSPVDIKKANLPKRWTFKKDAINQRLERKYEVPKAEKCLGAFTNLRQTVIPKLKKSGLETTSDVNKRKKINEEEFLKIDLLKVKEEMSQWKLSDEFEPPTKMQCIEAKPESPIRTKDIKREPECQLLEDNLVRTTKNRYTPVKIICSAEVTENTELFNLLEMRYNLNFVIRKQDDLGMNEMCRAPEFVLDENTAVVLEPLNSLGDPQLFLKLRKKMYALILRHSFIWVLLMDKTNNESGIHPNVLQMFSKLSLLSTQLNMAVKDFQSKVAVSGPNISIGPLVICRDADHTAYYIRRIVDYCFDTNTIYDANADLRNREWLLPTPSAHEIFLSRFPSLSSFHAQVMLCTSPLSWLMQASLEDLKNTIPIIPAKCLEMFHKLAHKRLPFFDSVDLGEEDSQEFPMGQTPGPMPRVLQQPVPISTIDHQTFNEHCLPNQTFCFRKQAQESKSNFKNQVQVQSTPFNPESFKLSIENPYLKTPAHSSKTFSGFGQLQTVPNCDLDSYRPLITPQQFGYSPESNFFYPEDTSWSHIRSPADHRNVYSPSSNASNTSRVPQLVPLPQRICESRNQFELFNFNVRPNY